MVIDQIKNIGEKAAFGVCTYWGHLLGLSVAKIRLYFIYLSFVTLGSPLIIYLIFAFWLNIKRYFRLSRSFRFE